MVNSTLKTLKSVSVECMDCFNDNAKKKEKKKGLIQYVAGKNDQIGTSVKLLDIMHKCYGFNADLIETF